MNMGWPMVALVVAGLVQVGLTLERLAPESRPTPTLELVPRTAPNRALEWSQDASPAS